MEAGDFKLISRRVVEELLKLNEKDPYLRGLVTWMGFQQMPVYYERQPRFKGRTHFPLLFSKGPIATFVYGFTSFSVIPLVAFLALGLLLTLISAATLAMLCVLTLCGDTPARGGWLMAGLVFLSGLQLMGIGTLGLYIGRIFNDVRRRPRYIIESTVGLDTDKA